MPALVERRQPGTGRRRLWNAGKIFHDTTRADWGEPMVRTIGPLVGILVVLGGLLAVLSPAAPSAPSALRTVPVELAGGALTPSTILVGFGEQVTLQITTDQQVRLRINGYGAERFLRPGSADTLTFDANRAGRFLIEDELDDRILGALIVEEGSGR